MKSKLYKGTTPSIMRATPGQAVTFIVYEYLKDKLEKSRPAILTRGRYEDAWQRYIISVGPLVLLLLVFGLSFKGCSFLRRKPLQCWDGAFDTTCSFCCTLECVYGIH
ncbi:hypothetical protein B0I37DRAFT_213747 [Chaetomium sp. MPI-CAGE-AT-0009]|nr:hypothetical protein B0I37DRAFT_213747 [Chaetomium sp. MPI-CAGE-AT-0009]